MTTLSSFCCAMTPTVSAEMATRASRTGFMQGLRLKDSLHQVREREQPGEQAQQSNHDPHIEPPYLVCPASAVVASSPPSPIVSTAVDGTITIAPFSLIASYSIFIARRCSAMGLSLYNTAASA